MTWGGLFKRSADNNVRVCVCACAYTGPRSLIEASADKAI